MIDYFTNFQSQKGVALIITFFVMVIILGISLSMSAILYSEIRIIRNIGNSVLAFYAAESGVEKVLYYDKKVLPVVADENVEVRGLCYMCQNNNPDACAQEPVGGGGDRSIYCNNCNALPLDTGLEGCNPDICNNCEVTFETNINDDRRYEVTATVSPFGDPSGLFLKIDSTGYYKEYVLRAIEINMEE
ncbi:MAG: pilus assembly PilX N-terminal domain-containing protein [bacterium]|nr:pilus assembly PilX N-terminal domain-containing protein [Pseudomonadota bacterium]